MGGKLKIQHTGNVDVGYTSQTQTGNIGVVGGANGLSGTSGGKTIAVIANIEYTTGSYAAGDAYIVTQKGKHKYLVANLATPTQTQTCILANVADGNIANLTAGQMAITANTGSADIAVYSITDSTILGFPTNYANANSQGNLATATSYFVSFVGANATVQPGAALSIANIAGY